MRFLRLLVLVVLVLVGASCGGGDFADEGDVPQEALVVMPGAVEVESTFTKGLRKTNVDGGHRDYNSIQTLVFDVDGMTGRDVYEWYLSELSDQGWEFSADASGIFDERDGDPDQCRPDIEGYCGKFVPIEDNDGVRSTISLHLFTQVAESGPHVGIAHIDDEIDGFRIAINVGLSSNGQVAAAYHGGRVSVEVAADRRVEGRWYLVGASDRP